jgi:hypothetical protein
LLPVPGAIPAPSALGDDAGEMKHDSTGFVHKLALSGIP